MINQRFNLLPHRQMSLAWSRKVLLRQMVVVSGLAILLVLLGQGWIYLQLSHVDEFGKTLDAEIGSLLPDYRQSANLRQQYAQLLARQHLIESLDARRSTSVLLLADVADALTGQIYLTRLAEDGERFRVEGRSVDNSEIARFLERLSASDYLTDVMLNEIRNQDQDAAAAFQFSINARVRLAGKISEAIESEKTP